MEVEEEGEEKREGKEREGGRGGGGDEEKEGVGWCRNGYKYCIPHNRSFFQTATQLVLFPCSTHFLCDEWVHKVYLTPPFHPAIHLPSSILSLFWRCPAVLKSNETNIARLDMIASVHAC